MTLASIRRLVANDAHACTFQSFGQYRTALLKAIDEVCARTSPVSTPARPEYCVNCYAGGPCTCDAGTQVAQPGEREAFEAWFCKEYHDRLCRNMPDKSYNDPTAHTTWDAWQARAALPASGPEQAGAVAWRDMATAPKDGTLLRLLVNFEHHATEDGEGPQPTIGSNTWDNHRDFDEWQFAGWNWEQDCYTQGIGKPIGWLPLLDAAPGAAIAAREQVLECERCGLSPAQHTRSHWCDNQSYTAAAHDEALMKLSQFAHTAAHMDERHMRNNLLSIADQLIALASREESPAASTDAEAPQQAVKTDAAPAVDAGERYATAGYAVAMRVLQSELYSELNDRERVDCDTLIAAGQAPSTASPHDASSTVGVPCDGVGILRAMLTARPDLASVIDPAIAVLAAAPSPASGETA